MEKSGKMSTRLKSPVEFGRLMFLKLASPDSSLETCERLTPIKFPKISPVMPALSLQKRRSWASHAHIEDSGSEVGSAVMTHSFC